MSDVGWLSVLMQMRRALHDGVKDLPRGRLALAGRSHGNSIAKTDPLFGWSLLFAALENIAWEIGVQGGFTVDEESDCPTEELMFFLESAHGLKDSALALKMLELSDMLWDRVREIEHE